MRPPAYCRWWTYASALALSLTLARTGRAEAPPQAEQTATADTKKDDLPRGGAAIYGAALAMKLSDIPLAMYGGGIMGVLLLKGPVEWRLEYGGELLFGQTEAGLNTITFSSTFGADFAFSILHVSPRLNLGVLSVARASGSDNPLLGPVFGGSVRLGPEFRLNDRNRIALDGLVRLNLAGNMALIGVGGALRYGFF